MSWELKLLLRNDQFFLLYKMRRSDLIIGLLIRFNYSKSDHSKNHKQKKISYINTNENNFWSENIFLMVQNSPQMNLNSGDIEFLLPKTCFSYIDCP